jgi:hypothetical protein
MASISLQRNADGGDHSPLIATFRDSLRLRQSVTTDIARPCDDLLIEKIVIAFIMVSVE